LQKKEEDNKSVDELANEVLMATIPQNKLLDRVRSRADSLQTAGVLNPPQQRSSEKVIADE